MYMYIHIVNIMLIIFFKSVNYKLAGKCTIKIRQKSTSLSLTKLEIHAALFILKNLLPSNYYRIDNIPASYKLRK